MRGNGDKKPHRTNPKKKTKRSTVRTMEERIRDETRSVDIPSMRRTASPKGSTYSTLLYSTSVPYLAAARVKDSPGAQGKARIRNKRERMRGQGQNQSKYQDLCGKRFR